MGDIDDAHDAEHQRQAKRRQRQHGGGDEAFEGGEEKMGSEVHRLAPADARSTPLWPATSLHLPFKGGDGCHRAAVAAAAS